MGTPSGNQVTAMKGCIYCTSLTFNLLHRNAKKLQVMEGVLETCIRGVGVYWIHVMEEK